MAQLAYLSYISVGEYLASEELSEKRREYAAGVVYEMCDETRLHNQILVNLAASWRMQSKGGQCQIFSQSVKLRVQWGEEDYFYYPDVMLVCDATDKASQVYCERPCVLVEVLSASTARIDREEKLRAYTTLPSLQAYVLVAQAAPHVTIYRRENGWQGETVNDLNALAAISCGAGAADLSLTLADIYEDVEFAPRLTS